MSNANSGAYKRNVYLFADNHVEVHVSELADIGWVHEKLSDERFDRIAADDALLEEINNETLRAEEVEGSKEDLSNKVASDVSYVSDDTHYATTAAIDQRIADISPKQIEWATRGTTTVSEIDTWIAAGKMVLLRDGFEYYMLSKNDGQGSAKFFIRINSGGNLAALDNTVCLYYVTDPNVYTKYTRKLESSGNKLASTATWTSDNTMYPTTKAVDARITELGVDIKWATYGNTTAAEINSWALEGKLVMCQYGQRYYTLQWRNGSGGSIFYTVEHSIANNTDGFRVAFLEVDADGEWSQVLRTINPQLSTNSWNSSDSKYPTTAAVDGQLINIDTFDGSPDERYPGVYTSSYRTNGYIDYPMIESLTTFFNHRFSFYRGNASSKPFDVLNANEQANKIWQPNSNIIKFFMKDKASLFIVNNLNRYLNKDLSTNFRPFTEMATAGIRMGYKYKVSVSSSLIVFNDILSDASWTKLNRGEFFWLGSNTAANPDLELIYYNGNTNIQTADIYEDNGDNTNTVSYRLTPALLASLRTSEADYSANYDPTQIILTPVIILIDPNGEGAWHKNIFFGGSLTWRLASTGAGIAKSAIICTNKVGRNPDHESLVSCKALLSATDLALSPSYWPNYLYNSKGLILYSGDAASRPSKEYLLADATIHEASADMPLPRLNDLDIEQVDDEPWKVWNCSNRNVDNPSLTLVGNPADFYPWGDWNSWGRIKDKTTTTDKGFVHFPHSYYQSEHLLVSTCWSANPPKYKLKGLEKISGVGGNSTVGSPSGMSIPGYISCGLVWYNPAMSALSSVYPSKKLYYFSEKELWLFSDCKGSGGISKAGTIGCYSRPWRNSTPDSATVYVDTRAPLFRSTCKYDNKVYEFYIGLRTDTEYGENYNITPNEVTLSPCFVIKDPDLTWSESIKYTNPLHKVVVNAGVVRSRLLKEASNGTTSEILYGLVATGRSKLGAEQNTTCVIWFDANRTYFGGIEMSLVNPVEMNHFSSFFASRQCFAIADVEQVYRYTEGDFSATFDPYTTTMSNNVSRKKVWLARKLPPAIAETPETSKNIYNIWVEDRYHRAVTWFTAGQTVYNYSMQSTFNYEMPKRSASPSTYSTKMWRMVDFDDDFCYFWLHNEANNKIERATLSTDGTWTEVASYDLSSLLSS